MKTIKVRTTFFPSPPPAEYPNKMFDVDKKNPKASFTVIAETGSQLAASAYMHLIKRNSQGSSFYAIVPCLRSAAAPRTEELSNT